MSGYGLVNGVGAFEFKVSESVAPLGYDVEIRRCQPANIVGDKLYESN
jgi:hypothetical protein